MWVYFSPRRTNMGSDHFRSLFWILTRPNSYATLTSVLYSHDVFPSRRSHGGVYRVVFFSSLFPLRPVSRIFLVVFILQWACTIFSKIEQLPTIALSRPIHDSIIFGWYLMRSISKSFPNDCTSSEGTIYSCGDPIHVIYLHFVELILDIEPVIAAELLQFYQKRRRWQSLWLRWKIPTPVQHIINILHPLMNDTMARSRVSLVPVDLLQMYFRSSHTVSRGISLTAWL